MPRSVSDAGVLGMKLASERNQGWQQVYETTSPSWTLSDCFIFKLNCSLQFKDYRNKLYSTPWHAQRIQRPAQQTLLVKVTKYMGLHECKVKGGVEIKERYGAKTKDKQSKHIGAFTSRTLKDCTAINHLYHHQLFFYTVLHIFSPLGSFCSLLHLPPHPTPAGSQCDIWRSDVAALVEEACDYAQLIWNH